jgi:hypothetical protein
VNLHEVSAQTYDHLAASGAALNAWPNVVPITHDPKSAPPLPGARRRFRKSVKTKTATRVEAGMAGDSKAEIPPTESTSISVDRPSVLTILRSAFASSIERAKERYPHRDALLEKIVLHFSSLPRWPLAPFGGLTIDYKTPLAKISATPHRRDRWRGFPIATGPAPAAPPHPRTPWSSLGETGDEAFGAFSQLWNERLDDFERTGWKIICVDGTQRDICVLRRDGVTLDLVRGDLFDHDGSLLAKGPLLERPAAAVAGVSAAAEGATEPAVGTKIIQMPDRKDRQQPAKSLEAQKPNWGELYRQVGLGGEVAEIESLQAKVKELGFDPNDPQLDSLAVWEKLGGGTGDTLLTLLDRLRKEIVEKFRTIMSAGAYEASGRCGSPWAELTEIPASAWPHLAEMDWAASAFKFEHRGEADVFYGLRLTGPAGANVVSIKPDQKVPGHIQHRQKAAPAGKGTGNRRGPKTATRERIARQMFEELVSGRTTVEKLEGMSGPALDRVYKAHRDTCKAARVMALAEFQSRQIAPVTK